MPKPILGPEGCELSKVYYPGPGSSVKLFVIPPIGLFSVPKAAPLLWLRLCFKVTWPDEAPKL